MTRVGYGHMGRSPQWSGRSASWACSGSGGSGRPSTTTMGDWMKRALGAIAALGLGAAMIAGVGTAAHAATNTTVVVTAADVGPTGDWHTADTRPPGTGTFENGPATPPL